MEKLFEIAKRENKKYAELVAEGKNEQVEQLNKCKVIMDLIAELELSKEYKNFLQK